MMSVYLVTGGVGFIGSHIVEELVRRGERVRILDNFSTGKMENVASFQEGIELMEGDLRHLDTVRQATEGVDYILHQGAIPSVPKSIDNPLDTDESNVRGTLNLLVAARDSGVKKVMYASSSAIYGDTPTLPKQEDMAPQPLSPYAVSKLAGEYYCLVFDGVYGLPTVSLRYFNVYGPRQNPDSQYAAVIPRFIKLVSAGEPPAIYGDGNQTRDFTFVKDVVRANILAAEQDTCGVYNVSRGECITVNRLAELISELAGNNIKPVYEKARPGDILHSLADISKAKEFGYEPEYDLKTGLAATIKWFNSR